MEEKLRLSHTILYSKGWYVRQKEQWKDLAKTLAKDGYITLQTEHDVAGFLLNYVSNHYEFIKKYYHCLSIAYMFDEVIKRRCWDSCSEDAAIIKVCLGIFVPLPREAFEIVEADETILPLSESAINFKQEENETENC